MTASYISRKGKKNNQKGAYLHVGLEVKPFTVVASQTRGFASMRSTNTNTHKQHDGSSRRVKLSRPALIKADGAEQRHVGPR